MSMIDKLKEWVSGEEEEEKPPKPIRDKQLESMEREWEFHQMQERKQLLKKLLAEKKKQRLKEGLFGKFEKQNGYLGKSVERKKVNVMGKPVNILKQDSIMKQKPLLKDKKRFI